MLSMSAARSASNSLAGSPPQRHRLSATARYNSPVSMCGKPKCAASARAMVPLPPAAVKEPVPDPELEAEDLAVDEDAEISADEEVDLETGDDDLGVETAGEDDEA